MNPRVSVFVTPCARCVAGGGDEKWGKSELKPKGSGKGKGGKGDNGKGEGKGGKGGKGDNSKGKGKSDGKGSSKKSAAAAAAVATAAASAAGAAAPPKAPGPVKKTAPKVGSPSVTSCRLVPSHKRAACLFSLRSPRQRPRRR